MGNCIGATTQHVPDAPPPRNRGRTHLRIFHLNDVYDLNHYPRIATAIAEFTAEVPQATILKTHGGDFLAPSLLSTLDQGAGAVQVMNAVGFDMCCFGNHEADVPFDSLVDRIHEMNAVWLNSNMRSINTDKRLAGQRTLVKGDKMLTPTSTLPPKCPDFHVVELENGRSVAFLGLVCGSGKYAKLYRDNPDGSGNFGGHAVNIELPNEAATAAVSRVLAAHPKVDCIVPLTHQNLADDKELATLGLKFPCILGGHDHEPSLTVVGSTHIVKAGEDAKNLAIIDLIWLESDEEHAQPSSVNIQLIPVPMKPQVLKKITVHKLELEQLQQQTGYIFIKPDSMATPKFYRPDRYVKSIVREASKCALAAQQKVLIPDLEQFTGVTGQVLSSLNARAGECTMGVLLSTALRDSTGSDCAVINGGSIRANKEYTTGQLTFGDVMTELPFPTPFVKVCIDGETLSRAIELSRASWQPEWLPATTEEMLEAQSGKRPGKALHCDDSMKVDPASNRLLIVAGDPFDARRIYTLMISSRLLNTDDNSNTILKAFANREAESIPPEDAGTPPLPLIEMVLGANPNIANDLNLGGLRIPVDLPLETVLPPTLRDFIPLMHSVAGRACAAKLKLFDVDLEDDPGDPVTIRELQAAVNECARELGAEIQSILATPDCIERCTSVVIEGIDVCSRLYDAVWVTIARAQSMDILYAPLSKLQTLGDSAMTNHKKWLSSQPFAKQCMLQRAPDIATLKDDASRYIIKQGYDELLSYIQACVPGATSPGNVPLEAAALKLSMRMLEKTLLRFENDCNASNVADIKRSMCAVSSFVDFTAVINALIKSHVAKNIVIIRVKDRLTESAAGWRDVMINFYLPSDTNCRHVCELQIVHTKMLSIRKHLDGHAIYVRIRNAFEILEKLGVIVSDRNGIDVHDKLLLLLQSESFL